MIYHNNLRALPNKERVVHNYKLHFDMAAKVSPRKSYLREFEDACRLSSSDADNMLRYTTNK
jgi:hypothetical protein